MVACMTNRKAFFLFATALDRGVRPLTTSHAANEELGLEPSGPIARFYHQLSHI
jgi:hypothetical protein